MARIKLTIEYVGTDFCGWQSQKNGVSVQDELERALTEYFGCPIRTSAAGRTDKGVHAKGQTVHFDTDKSVNPYKLCLGLNVALPETIAVTEAQTVPQTFDARFSALSKTYCYRMYVSPTRRPTLDVNHAQTYKHLDVAAMRRAAQMLVGTHDFSAFQKAGSNLKGTVRTVNSFDIVETPQGTLEFWVNGNAFLYNQVRIMCGLLVEVGKGKFNLQDVTDMLDGRKLTFKTLPAKGLTLEKVFYSDKDLEL
ncbi:MAG: tRNA pseudouridine(38-40) synthase TruA [Corallococcus sp.]|nr:tRNA pseudouridine(38-40) synthase TruA [Corallococcus sp.]MCM1360032.1 tRNA pseudouridine(38-40) synthase TruA [Corallococcus sp.]MCM1395589.1 tRNA pseudouridine(38-40) synthase TruA [Corallococcus sp.]